MSHTEGELDAFADWERQSWETRAAPYAQTITSLTRGGADALLDAAETGAATRLLDVATGPGVVAAAARDRGAEVIAVDQAEAMARMAGGAGFRSLRASAERLPIRDAAFDAVVAGFLLNHLARPRAAVLELARVCRGRVALSVWDRPSANPVLGLFGSVVQPAEASALPPGPAPDLYADEALLTALLADAGLDDVRVDRVEWSLTVDPGAWFDAVAAGTPRTGGVLAVATAEQRAAMRERYVELTIASHGATGDLVELPAAALVASGRSPARP